MHLHERRFDEKAGLAAAGTADYKNVLVAGIFRLLRAAVHGEPFRLREGDIVLKYRVYVRLYVLCRSPAGGTVLNALTVFLRVLAFHVDNKPDNHRPGNADQQVSGVEAGRGTGKSSGKALPKM